MDIIQLLVSGLGGGVLGPIISKVLGGSLTKGGIGGLATGAAAQNGVALPSLNGGEMMAYLSSFLQGGVGGGVLGTLAGILMKNKG
jgi:hypothetical protein